VYRFACIVAAFGAALSIAANAETPKPKLDAAARASAIEGVLRCVDEGYVFPDVAKKMVDAVRARAARKEYDAIEDGDALAEKLTQDLRAVSHDLHLHVSYSAEVLLPEPAEPFSQSPDDLAEMRRVLARQNFGFARVEVLKGNTGYLQFDYFAPPEIAAETCVAAMSYVANTDALILDLRGCSGSMSEDALPMLCSYFFERPVHLNDFYWRHTGRTRQSWTWAYVPGKRYLNKPIYVLTSGKTFSGAEELAYDLKNLKRATLVGEATGGGANGGGSRRADDHFSVWVPNGRAINPITGTNWEGTGVAPDIGVPAVRALHTARLAALRQLIATAGDAGWKEELKRTVADLEREQQRFKKVTFRLEGHPDAKEVTVAGTFNFWAWRANRLARQGNAWVGEVEAEPGRHAYKFVVDGRWLPDPANPRQESEDANSNSVIVVE
jgi:retinol-binding protein 3